MIALLPTLLLAAAAQTLQPTGKWSVEYNDGNCTLSRGFGDPAKPVVFGFKPYPQSMAGDLALVLPKHGGAALRTGHGTIMLTPGGKPLPVFWLSAPVADGDRRAYRFEVARTFWETLAAAETITFDPGGRPAITVALGPIKGALAALATCGDDLLRHWGADPAAMVMPSDLPQLVKWFDRAHYPGEAELTHQQGRVITLTRFGPGGAPDDCRVVQTSGVPSLDKQTCATIMRYFKVPVVNLSISKKRFMVLPVRWVMP